MGNKYKISVLNKHKDFKFKDKKLISKILDFVLKNEIIKEKSPIFKHNFEKLCLDLVFVGDNEIQNINVNYRGKNSPTDVISFALFADDENAIMIGGEIYLGEIIISYDTAKKQAKTTLEEEITTLITHGILHLLGFDHLEEEDYNFIVGLQNEAVKEIL